MEEKILFDAHAHINEESIDDQERQELIKAIEASQVAYVMDIGYDLEGSRLAVEDARNNPWCYAAVGVHPHDAKTVTEEVLKSIEDLAADSKVKAIGEIGLDFHYDLSERDVQREVFRQQIRLANKLRMPIVIHSREADAEVMEILKEEGAFTDERKSWFPERRVPDTLAQPICGVRDPAELKADARVQIHCFSGSRELAEEYVKLGATVSICGPVTFKNNRKTVDVVSAIPLEFLLIETDAPYLAPEPKRGKRNMSPYVEYVARRVAVIKGLTYEEVALETMKNAKVFFDIPVE